MLFIEQWIVGKRPKKTSNVIAYLSLSFPFKIVNVLLSFLLFFQLEVFFLILTILFVLFEILILMILSLCRLGKSLVILLILQRRLLLLLCLSILNLFLQKTFRLLIIKIFIKLDDRVFFWLAVKAVADLLSDDF